jgi:thiamine phosphate synthase YjbQ (UPF0047 family)
MISDHGDESMTANSSGGRTFATTLSLSPSSRFDVIDVHRILEDLYDGALDRFRRVLYFSHHTTAGFLDQRVARRLHNRRDGFDGFVRSFQQLFPRGAGYRHDAMDLRAELTEEDRLQEPPNGDAHLTFMSSGLQSCVTYFNRPGLPVFLLDLDGVYRGTARQRNASVVAYDREAVVAEVEAKVPVSRHAIDSVNLRDRNIGLDQQIDELLQFHGVENGRLDIVLDAHERTAGLTVNEYETLLMRHDLADVLRDPFRFMAHQGRRMLRDPRAVATKSLGYARYDVVRVINRLMDAAGLSESAFETLLSRLMALPAQRRLRFKRSLSIPVTTDDGRSRIVTGRYQTPILIQWAAAHGQTRNLRLRLTRFTDD